MWHSTRKQSQADSWRLPWGSSRHFPARARHHREAWPEGTSPITGWDCCQRYAWISLSWIPPYRHSDLHRTAKTPWSYYHTAASAILKCPRSSCDHEATSKKKKSQHPSFQKIFFSPPSLWVGRCIPWKSTWSRHLRGLLEKNMSAEMDGGGERGEFALCYVFKRRCGLLGQVVSKKVWRINHSFLFTMDPVGLTFTCTRKGLQSSFVHDRLKHKGRKC